MFQSWMFWILSLCGDLIYQSLVIYLTLRQSDDFYTSEKEICTVGNFRIFLVLVVVEFCI